jgi:uncharacterized repeat protein (TIGR04042 family)
MPSVNIRLRWPDGRESLAYSPSTIIHQHLRAGQQYPLADFLQRADSGLHAASERVRQVRGFACSAALDSLGDITAQAAHYSSGDVLVLAMRES